MHVALISALLLPVSPDDADQHEKALLVGTDMSLAIQVRLVNRERATEPMTSRKPSVEQPPRKSGRRLVSVPPSLPLPTAPSKSAQQIVTSGSLPAAAAVLFKSDGNINLATQEKKGYHGQELERAEELLNRGHNVLKCKQTRFAKVYVPYETVGEQVARKLRFIGLYNPETAKAAKGRQERAALACDGQ